MNTELVCINKTGTWFSSKGRPKLGPKYGELVTYDGMCDCGCEWIYIKEYNYTIVYRRVTYSPKYFVPLDQFNKQESESILNKVEQDIAIEYPVEV